MAARAAALGAIVHLPQSKGLLTGGQELARCADHAVSAENVGSEFEQLHV